MGWTISVSSKGFEGGMNAGVTTPRIVTSSTRHAVPQWSFTPNAGRTTLDQAGSNPAWQTRRVWQNVLSTLVGFD